MTPCHIYGKIRPMDTHDRWPGDLNGPTTTLKCSWMFASWPMPRLACPVLKFVDLLLWIKMFFQINNDVFGGGF